MNCHFIYTARTLSTVCQFEDEETAGIDKLIIAAWSMPMAFNLKISRLSYENPRIGLLKYLWNMISIHEAIMKGSWVNICIGNYSLVSDWSFMAGVAPKRNIFACQNLFLHNFKYRSIKNKYTPKPWPKTLQKDAVQLSHMCFPLLWHEFDNCLCNLLSFEKPFASWQIGKWSR
jgi:hypothetical protein